MGEKIKPINALIIDDEQQYIDALKVSANKKRIILDHANNLEDGIVKLRTKKNIEFVILDGKCFVDADQTNTVENMPIRAQRYIEDINREQNRQIFYCINTGYFDQQFVQASGVIDRIFNKDNETAEKMFEYIWQVVPTSDEYKLRNKYEDAFMPFTEGYLKMEYEYRLIDMLNKLESGTCIIDDFITIRHLMEAIFKGLIEVGCMPEEFLDVNGTPIHEFCTLYLENRNVLKGPIGPYQLSVQLPKHIKPIFRKIKESTDDNAHLEEADDLTYEYRSDVYGMLELLKWLPSFIEENYS
jgi:hypothetical protein